MVGYRDTIRIEMEHLLLKVLKDYIKRLFLEPGILFVSVFIYSGKEKCFSDIH